MDPEMCEAVRQLCMLAAHEESDEKLATLVREIYHLVSASPLNRPSSVPLDLDIEKSSVE